MKKIIVAMPTGFFSLLATLFLAYLSLAANPLDVQSVKLFPHANKCAHFLMYFGCTTVYLFEYAKRKLPHHTSLSVELAITTFAAVMGILLEIAQLTLTNSREFEYLDCVANATGAFAGFMLMRFWGMHFIRNLLYHTVTRRKHHRRYKSQRKIGQQ